MILKLRLRFFSLFNELIEMFILPSSLVPNSIFLSVFENAYLLLIENHIAYLIIRSTYMITYNCFAT